MSMVSGGGIAGGTRWSLRLFGGFELLALPGREPVSIPSKRDRVLLAHLILSPDHGQPRRKLTSLLWGEASDETSLDNLRVCIWSLRKALGDGKHRIVASDGDDVVIDSTLFEVDVLQFREAAGQKDAPALQAAANLYTGELLDGLSIDSEKFESWRRAEALQLRTKLIDVLVRLMAQAEAANEFDRAAEMGERVLVLDPLHEPAVRCLMRVRTATGQRSAAISLYRGLADALRAQLGSQPEPETRALFAEIGNGTNSVSSHIDSKRPFFLRFTPKSAWVAAGLAAAAAIAVVLRFAMPPAPTVNGVDAAKTAAASPANAVSIAVLPFLNLSGDASQDFFSDGLTEEISAALARVPDLRVVARSSAFQFRGPGLDITRIGRQLHATHVIEGSVRKEGDRVRITAELVDAGSGVRVASHVYDRKMGDIFSTQEDITRNIVAALMAPVGLAPGEQLVSSRDIDPDSYQQYLRAKQMLPRSGYDGLMEMIRILEPIVARHPDFAPAWAKLAAAYQRIPFFSDGFEYWSVEQKRRVADEWLSKAQSASTHAIELDPNLPDGYLASAVTMTFRGQLLDADRLFNKALALAPLDPEALHSYANFLVAVGHTKEALATRRQLIGLEPFVLIYTSTIPDLLWINGDAETAISNMVVTRSPTDLSYLAKIYEGEGRHTDAIKALKEIPAQSYPEGKLQTAVHLLEGEAADATSLRDTRLPRRLNFVYITAGAPEQALDFFEREVAAGYASPNLMVDLWTPIYASVRKTERFKAYARDAGLVEYWRAKGWPSFCHPTSDRDFACN